MTKAKELANRIKGFLMEAGSIDACVIDGKDISLKFGFSAKAHAAVYCKDKSLSDYYEFSSVFEELALGDESCFAVPYDRNLLLIFEEVPDEQVQRLKSGFESIQTEKLQVAAV